MAAKDKINKAGEAGDRAAQRSQYLQRLLADEELRGSLVTAYGAARSAYGRMTNGKPATQALFEDKKLQRELKEAADALRDASGSLRESPKRRGAKAAPGARCCCSPSPACWRSRSARACARSCSTCCSAPRRSSTTARRTAPAEPAPAGATAS